MNPFTAFVLVVLGFVAGFMLYMPSVQFAESRGVPEWVAYLLTTLYLVFYAQGMRIMRNYFVKTI